MSQVPATDGLNATILRGTLWVAALRLFVRCLGVISTVILARLLVPDDFGLVALAAVIAASIELLGSFNFDIWLVRHQRPQREDYDTVWTLALLRDLTVAILLVVFAAPLSVFFADPRLESILRVLALATAVGAFSNIGVIDFRRDMAFDREFRLFALQKVCSFVVTIVLALIWRNYWAMVGGILASAMARLILSYGLHPYRPRLSLAVARRVLEFSKWLLLLSITGFLYRRLQTLFIGKIMGSSALGVFAMSQQASDMATTELLMPLRRVLVPAYARMRSDMSLLRSSFADTFAVILLFGLPLVAGIAMVAHPLVEVLLGPKWSEVAPLMQIMAVYAMGTVLLANQGPVLMALGHTRLLSSLYGFGLLIKVPVLLWATGTGDLHRVALSVAAVHIVLFVVSIVLTLRTLQLSLGELLLQSWHAVAGAACMSAVVVLLQQRLLPEEAAAWVVLLSAATSGVLVYSLSVLVLWRIDKEHGRGETMIIEFLARRLHRAAA